MRNQSSSLQQVGWIEAGNRIKKEEGVKSVVEASGFGRGGVDVTVHRHFCRRRCREWLHL